MIDRHHIANYLIGGGALVLAATGYYDAGRVSQHAQQLDSAISHIAPEQHSRLSWSGLTQDQTIALGEALKRVSDKAAGTMMGSPVVTIYCASVNCAALRNDFDDAFQIAGWTSGFEEQPVDSEEDEGIFVGPPGPGAKELGDAITKATDLPVKEVDIGGIEGVGVIIGKKPN
jgi:hypothetical protein